MGGPEMSGAGARCWAAWAAGGRGEERARERGEWLGPETAQPRGEGFFLFLFLFSISHFYFLFLSLFISFSFEQQLAK
jgi:hypothetical protein